VSKRKKEMYKVLMCGDRNWNDDDAIAQVMNELVEQHGVNNLLIIHGGAVGADVMAGEIANRFNVHTAEVCALWDTRHRGAGPQRNEVMLKLRPDEVIAFHGDIERSRGTADMVRRAEKADWHPLVRVIVGYFRKAA
jgi:hypothetical protein